MFLIKKSLNEFALKIAIGYLNETRQSDWEASDNHTDNWANDWADKRADKWADNQTDNRANN